MIVKVLIDWTLSMLVLVAITACWSSAEDVDGKHKVPDWVQSDEPVRVSDIPEEDYSYLAQWLDRHAKPAQEYLVELFARHQVVIFGEAHNAKEHKDFIIELIPRLYQEAGVRCIGWEFSRHTDNKQLAQLVTAPQYDQECALAFARDQLAHEWNSKEHWDIMEAVWRVNNSLEPGQERMRLVGLTMNFDWTQFFITVKTEPEDSAEYQEIIAVVARNYDRVMAEQVEKEIIEEGQKGLVFVGRCHDFTHHEFPPDVNFGRDIMGNLLYKKYGDHVFQVWPGSGMFPVIEEVMKLRGDLLIGFDLYASPFANIRSPAGWDAPDVPLSNIARGYVYLGPTANLHKNTPIEGFVTNEMFRRYQRYYEIAFGRTFQDAADVDRYLQAHRFPAPY